MSYRQEYERLLREKSDLRSKKNKTILKLKEMLFDEEVKNNELVEALKEIANHHSEHYVNAGFETRELAEQALEKHGGGEDANSS